MNTRTKSNRIKPSELGRCDWWRYNSNARKLQYSREPRVPKLLTLIPRKVIPQELTITRKEPSTCTLKKNVNKMIRENDFKGKWSVWNNHAGIRCVDECTSWSCLRRLSVWRLLSIRLWKLRQRLVKTVSLLRSSATSHPMTKQTPTAMYYFHFL